MVSVIMAWGGVRWMGLPHSPKINGDHIIKDNLGRYCPKTFEVANGKERKVAPPGIEPRASGLSRQRSATEP